MRVQGKVVGVHRMVGCCYKSRNCTESCHQTMFSVTTNRHADNHERQRPNICQPVSTLLTIQPYGTWVYVQDNQQEQCTSPSSGMCRVTAAMLRTTMTYGHGMRMTCVKAAPHQQSHAALKHTFTLRKPCLEEAPNKLMTHPISGTPLAGSIRATPGNAKHLHGMQSD